MISEAQEAALIRLPRDDLMRALTHFGWTNVEVAFDEPSHPNGPSLALVATRD